MNKSSVTVVIVTYQSRQTIDQALQSLQPSIRAGVADCVVVDNASSDGTADHIESQYPEVTLVRSAANLGFGRACNLGSESVDTPYIMFLNPDASIDLDELQKLIVFMESHPNAGIAGPATYDTTAESFQAVGMLLTPMSMVRATLRLSGAHPTRRILKYGETPYQTNWVCGSSMLVRTSAFRALQGFDPRYFLYFEETDLCLRATRAGQEIWAVGDAMARHIGAVSAREAGSQLTDRDSGSIVEYFYPSRFYYLSKNFGWLSAVCAETITQGVEWLRWVVKKLIGRSEHFPAGKPFLRLPAKVDK